MLYPDGRVSPTQEAQLTMFNGEPAQRARLRGGRQLRRLPAAGEDGVRRRGRCAAQCALTSANSINVGRLLPQMVYYFHAVAQLRAQRGHDIADCLARRAATSATSPPG